MTPPVIAETPDSGLPPALGQVTEVQGLLVADPTEQDEPFADFGGESAETVQEPEIPPAELRALVLDALRSWMESLGDDGRRTAGTWVRSHGFTNTAPLSESNPTGLPDEKLKEVYEGLRMKLDEVAR